MEIAFGLGVAIAIIAIMQAEKKPVIKVARKQEPDLEVNFELLADKSKWVSQKDLKQRNQILK